MRRNVSFFISLLIILISLASCGRTAFYFSPLTGQVNVVAASNLVVTAIDLTNSVFGTYQGTLWTATGTVLLRDAMGDVGLSIMPSNIILQRRTTNNTSVWYDLIIFAPDSVAYNTNIPRSRANTVETFAVTFNWTVYNYSAAQNYTNANNQLRGTYTLAGSTHNGESVYFIDADRMRNVPASLTRTTGLAD